MGEASERAAEAGWIAQCLIAGIAHPRDRTPGITYVAVPSGQRGELREFGVPRRAARSAAIGVVEQWESTVQTLLFRFAEAEQ